MMAMIPGEAVLIVLRYLLSSLAAVLTAHGLLILPVDPSVINATAQIIVGAVGFVVPLGWGLWRSRRHAIIAQAARLPGVTVVVDPDHCQPKP